MVLTEPHNHERFVQGRDRIALVVRLLLQRNGLSHTEFHEFYKWTSPDTPTWLSRSQVSTLRNAKLPKPGPQIFDALGTVNLRFAQLAGEDSPEIRELPKLGPLPVGLRRLSEEKPFFMQNPHTGLPMDGGDMFRLYCSKLEIAPHQWQETPPAYDDDAAADISQRLALWAQRWMVGKQLIPNAAKSVFLNAYPVEDQQRRERCWDVALGRWLWSSDEASEERDALRFLIGNLEGRPALSVREFDRWIRGEKP